MIHSSSSTFQQHDAFLYTPTKTSALSPHSKRSEKWDPKPSEDEPGEQKAHHCISLRDPIRYYLIRKNNLPWKTKACLSVDDVDFITLSNPVKLVVQYKDSIQHHVAMRVALFFQQAIVCHGTFMHFKISDTEGQFFTAPSLHIKSSASTTNISYQAAHHSTIPQLKACEKNTDLSNLSNYSIYLKGSHLEILNNSTIALPDFVNKIDTLVDGQSNSLIGLRYETLLLINQLAEAKLSPTQATRKFIETFSEMLVKRPQESKNLTAEKLEVINIYKTKVEEMRKLALLPDDAPEVHPFFDPQVGIQLDKEDKRSVAIIRKLVCEQRFKMIREGRLAESKIQALIDQGFQTSRTPEKKHRIRLCLTYASRGDAKLKIILEKLFCISIAEIERNPRLCFGLADQFNQSKTIYETILKQIWEIIIHFQKIERCSQAKLLKSFRVDVRKQTEQQLTQAFLDELEKKLFQEKQKIDSNQKRILEMEKMLEAKDIISKIENLSENEEVKDQVLFSELQVEFLAKALHVQSSYFFCHLFASSIE